MHKILDAIFRFRNYALHQGYEWPPESRERFMKLVNDNQWNDWFATATSGGETWVVYATDNLIRTSLDLLSELLDSFRKIENELKPEK